MTSAHETHWCLHTSVKLAPPLPNFDTGLGPKICAEFVLFCAVNIRFCAAPHFPKNGFQGGGANFTLAPPLPNFNTGLGPKICAEFVLFCAVNIRFCAAPHFPKNGVQGGGANFT